MAGILNSKSRVLDNIITFEGKRQIANGKLSIEYVTFTDSATFYSSDEVSGSKDASYRIYFESCNLPQDSITFQADDSGLLKPGGPFKAAGNYSLYRGELFTGSNSGLTSTTPAIFASQIDGILSASIDNYKMLQAIGTIDGVYDDDQFLVSPKNITFTITNELPISDKSLMSVNINTQESLFNDPKLAKLANFKFLPPITKTNDKTVDKKDASQTKNLRVGNYVPLGRTSTDDQLNKDLEESLMTYEQHGYMKSVAFEQTTRNNTLIAQIFETNGTHLKKLDVIDFGSYVKTVNGKKINQQVFFAGKLFVDDNGTHSFIHIFTIVFE